MITLVIGGSGSGKSAFAEECLLKAEDAGNRYYIATMDAAGAEGALRVERHRKLREGKGFLTLEQPRNIREVEKKTEPFKNAAILECVSNLLANEMFGDEKKDETRLQEREDKPLEIRLAQEILQMTEHFRDTIIVSNNVFEDGIEYDAVTTLYQKRLGALNAYLAEAADRVYEVVVGIPIRIK